MVVEELIRQLNSRGVAFQCSYYRTGAGAEVDLILEGDFGLVAVEAKHASTVTGHSLRVLREFAAEHQARIAVIITTDVAPRLYEERMLGLPFNFL
jgi:hypothetical protein